MFHTSLVRVQTLLEHAFVSLVCYTREPSCSVRMFNCVLYEVDPHQESGQSLYRQYAGKKGKIVLNAKWVIECVNAGQLQTYHNNWAGCKVTGQEQCASYD